MLKGQALYFVAFESEVSAKVRNLPVARYQAAVSPPAPHVDTVVLYNPNTCKGQLFYSSKYPDL